MTKEEFLIMDLPFENGESILEKTKILQILKNGNLRIPGRRSISCDDLHKLRAAMLKEKLSTNAARECISEYLWEIRENDLMSEGGYGERLREARENLNGL